jgi:hypothetical protein
LGSAQISGTLPLGEVPAHLLDDLARLDDVLGAGLVVRLRMGDHVQDVRLHVELGVDAEGQVALGLVEVGREAGQAAAGLLDDVEVEVAGQRLDQLVGALHLGQVVHGADGRRQLEHHLHHVVLDAQLERDHPHQHVVGHLHIVGGVAQPPLVRVVDLQRLAPRPTSDGVVMLVEAVADGDRPAAVELVVEEDRHGREAMLRCSSQSLASSTSSSVPV